MTARPRFITLEGGEGSGKSTQARALAARLVATGVPAILTREPGGSEGAEAIRALLLDGPADRWTMTGEALLFAAARADHVARTISPALAAGIWVICDRFVDSARAYQGASGLDDGDIMALHRFGSSGLLPDLTFLLTLDAASAAARARARDGGQGDRIGARDAAYHAAVAARFAAIAAAEPGRILSIDAAGDAVAVTDRMVAALADKGWLA